MVEWPVRLTGLAKVRAEVGDCLRCPLHTSRRSVVFGIGSMHADLMVVGEQPGPLEDRFGEPFVGQSGAVLDRLLMDAFGLNRADVYLTTVVMCRAPGNRRATHDEIGRCLPFLGRKVAIIRPRAVLLVGSTASSALLCGQRLSECRGQLFDNVRVGGHTARMVATFHPAYLARVPERYSDAVADARRLSPWVRLPRVDK